MKNLFTLLLVGTLLSAPAMAKNNCDTGTCLDFSENVKSCFAQSCIGNNSCGENCLNDSENKSNGFLSNLLNNLCSGNISTGWQDVINSYLENCFPDIDFNPAPPSDSLPTPPPENEETPDVPGDTPGDVPGDSPSDTPSDKPSEDIETPNSDFVSEVIRLVNVERNKVGLGNVSESSALNSAALSRAKEIVSLFSHTRPDGRSCFTVLSDMGISYNGAGENIAMGQTSPAQVMSEWMNSEGHRANILNSSFKNLGVGVYKVGTRYYWAQMFTY